MDMSNIVGTISQRISKVEGFRSGLAAGALNPILSVMMFGLVPEELRSRVFGVTAAICFAAMPLGPLVCGYLTDGVGLTAALLAAGGVYLLATLCPVVFPSWRAMNAPDGVSSSVPSPRSAEPSEH
jgi:MFS family permease